MEILGRCVHCGDIMPHIFSSWHQYWGECELCREWQRYLWDQRPPQAVITDAELWEMLAEVEAIEQRDIERRQRLGIKEEGAHARARGGEGCT